MQREANCTEVWDLVHSQCRPTVPSVSSQRVFITWGENPTPSAQPLAATDFLSLDF